MTRRRLLSGAAALLVAMAGLLGSGPAAASGATPTQATAALPGADQPAAITAAVDTAAVDTAVDPAAAVTVSILSQTPAVLTPGDALTLHVRVTRGVDAPAPRKVTVRLNRSVMSLAAIDPWLTDPDVTTAVRVTTVTLPTIPEPGTAVDLDLTVSPESLRLRDDPAAFGPRAVSVEATDGSGRLATTATVAVWRPTKTEATVRLATVVELAGWLPSSVAAPDAGTAATGVPTAGDSTADRATDDPTAADPDLAATDTTSPEAPPAPDEAWLAAERRINRIVNGLSTGAVTWVVDPAVLSAAAASPETNGSWVAAVTSGLRSGSAVPLPWGDTDLDAVARVDATSIAAVAVQRSQQGTGRGVWWWTPTGGLSSASATIAAASGAAGVVIDPDAVTEEVGAPTIITSSGLTVAVPDPVLSALVFGDGGASTAASQQRLLAISAAIAAADPGRPLLIASGRDWDGSPTTAAAAIALLASSGWVDQTSLPGLVDAAAADGDAVSSPSPPTGSNGSTAGAMDGGTVSALLDARTAVITFAPVVADPATLVEPTTSEILLALSTSGRADTAARDARAQEALAAASARVSGLSLAVSGHFTIFSRNTAVRIGVSNDRSDDVTVQLQLSPHKGCLVAAGPVTVTVPAGQDVTAEVPVKATAACDVVVGVRLTTQDGADVAASGQFSARVAPSIEGAGGIALAVILGIGVVAGIIRTVRRGPRGSRAAAAGLAGGPGSQESQ